MLSPATEYMIDCKIERMILKSKAVNKPSTANPPTILVHNKIISALIMSKNKPKVNKVTGKVSKTRMGLMKTLSKPNTMATMTEVVKLATETPGMKWAMAITNTAVTKILRIRFMRLDFTPKLQNSVQGLPQKTNATQPNANYEN